MMVVIHTPACSDNSGGQARNRHFRTTLTTYLTVCHPRVLYQNGRDHRQANNMVLLTTETIFFSLNTEQLSLGDATYPRS